MCGNRNVGQQSAGWGRQAWSNSVGEWDHPEAGAGAFVAADDNASTILDAASNFVEFDLAPRVAHCNYQELGVQCKAGDDVGGLGIGGQHWNVQGACVRGLYAFTI